jgi:hypothetical protein
MDSNNNNNNKKPGTLASRRPGKGQSAGKTLKNCKSATQAYNYEKWYYYKQTIYENCI